MGGGGVGMSGCVRRSVFFQRETVASRGVEGRRGADAEGVGVALDVVVSEVTISGEITGYRGFRQTGVSCQEVTRS